MEYMDTSILNDVGLTNAEIKIYIALLGLGTSTAGPILEKTGLQNSVVHLTLHKLVEKGFVSFVKKGSVKHYHPVDPNYLVKFIDEKKKRIEALVPLLVSQQQKVERNEAEVFEGLAGLKAMLHEFIKDAKKGDEYLFFSFYVKNPKEFENVFKFYNDFDKERERRGLVTKGIVPTALKPLLKGRKMRTLLFVDFPISTNISICKDKVIFTPWEEQKISFLIKSRQLADSFRVYFYSIWNKYKK